MLVASICVLVATAAALQMIVAADLPRLLSAVECIAIAAIMGTIGFVFVGVISSHFMHTVSFSTSVLPCVVVASVVFFRLRDRRTLQLLRRVPTQMRHDPLFVLMLLIVTWCFSHMLSTHMLKPMAEDTYGSAGSCWGDLAYHLGIINSFVTGANKDVDFLALQNPILAGEKLVYPFVPNFQTAMLMTAGSGTRAALVVPSLVLCICIHVVLYYIIVRFGDETPPPAFPPRGQHSSSSSNSSSNHGFGFDAVSPSHAAGLLGVLLLVCSGGWGWQHYLDTAHKGGDYLQAVMEVDYVHEDGHGTAIDWFSYIGDTLMAQRSSLYGFSLTFTVIHLVWLAVGSKAVLADNNNNSNSSSSSSNRKGSSNAGGGATHAHADDDIPLEELAPQNANMHHHTADDADHGGHGSSKERKHAGSTRWQAKLKRRVLFTSGVAMGMIPLCQAHATIAAAVFVAATALLFAPFRMPRSWGRYILDWIYMGLPAAVLGIPQVLLYLGRAGEVSIRYEPLWTRTLPAGSGWWVMGKAFVKYWPHLLGVLPVVATLGFVYLNGRQRRLHGAFCAVNLIASVVMFTPWHNDNIKLLYIWHMGSCVVAALSLAKLCAPRSGWIRHVPLGLRLLAMAILLVLCTFTGMLSMMREGSMQHVFLGADKMHVGTWVKENTPSTAVFASGDDHIHPVTNVGGRRLIAGFAGWLWSHGYKEQAVERGAQLGVIFSAGSLSKRDTERRVHALRKYAASWVICGPNEKAKFRLSSCPEAFHHPPFVKMYENYGTFIYKLQADEPRGDGKEESE